MRKAIIALSLKLLGTAYIWGGSSPRFGFDCSGFVVWVYQVFGILGAGDWTAQGLYDELKDNDTSGPLEPGDPVFYGKSTRKITHVMLYMGKLDGVDYVIGASGGDSTTKTESDALKREAKIKIKQLSYRSDLVDSLHLDINYAA